MCLPIPSSLIPSNQQSSRLKYFQSQFLQETIREIGLTFLFFLWDIGLQLMGYMQLQPYRFQFLLIKSPKITSKNLLPKESEQFPISGLQKLSSLFFSFQKGLP